MSKCNYCKSKLKKLRYLADFDYGISSYSVELQHEVEVFFCIALSAEMFKLKK